MNFSPLRPTAPLDAVNHGSPTRLLLVVEGLWDIQCLIKFSQLMYRHDAHLPDLGLLEETGQMVFFPVGGDNLGAWIRRLDPLKRPEFHLFDREISPVTELRRRAVEVIRRRPRCVAMLTRKRALENYLHADAIEEACGLSVDVDEDGDIPERLARAFLTARGEPSWEALPARSRRRWRFRAKRWLLSAIGRMTLASFVERDPHGEVIGWLKTIAELLGEGEHGSPSGDPR